MKKIIAIFSIILLLCGCATQETNEQNTQFYFESELLPFYCIDTSDVLWRVENEGAYSLNARVGYGENESFVKYIKKQDTVIFAYDINVKNGVKFCSLGMSHGKSEISKITENIRFDSLRINNWGELLAINNEDVLLYYRNGLFTEITANAAQAEFVGNDSFLIREKQGTYSGGEIVYPIYAYESGYRNYITDAPEIMAGDSEKAFIIKNRHTVQKRASSKEVAQCSVYSGGDIKFDISSVEISQLENSGKHTYLLSVRENSPTLKYDLYKIDGNELELKASDIISGAYISSDRAVYAYESEENGNVKTTVIGNKTNTYDSNGSVSGIYSCGDDLYVYSDGNIYADHEKIGSEIESVVFADDKMICIQENMPPYKIYLCENREFTLMANDVASMKFTYKDGYLYYYTGEKGAYDLAIADPDGNETAYISNVDSKIGFIGMKGCVAAAKSDSKSLYIADNNSIADTGIKIKQFATDVIE